MPGDFWRVCVAAVVSHLGSGASGTASALLAASLTRAPRAVALVGVCSGLPWLLFALHTGTLADRWDRKRAMWLCDLASAVQFAVLAVTVVTGRANLAVLCVVAFGTATVSTLFDSASQAALPSLVPTPLLDRANSRFYAGTVLTGFLLGPPLGSWAFGLAPALPFGLDVVSFLGSAALILGVRTRIRATDEDRDTTGITRQIAVGLRWLWRHRQLRALVVLLTVWNLAETATIAVLVLYVLEVLHVGPSFYGLLLSGLAVGGLAGSAAAPWLRRRLGLGGVIAGTVVLSVMAYLLLALTTTPWIAVLLLGLIGFAAFAFNVVSASYRGEAVPDHLRGRVYSAYRFATWGVTPIGAALGGVVAAAFGLPAVFAATAAVLAAVAVVTLPSLTNARLAAP
nr:MFS transporter [Petropleomorpha daqingensis]